jgi:hypothetical protein
MNRNVQMAERNALAFRPDGQSRPLQDATKGPECAVR